MGWCWRGNSTLKLENLWMLCNVWACRRLGVQRLVICGVQTPNCIRATVYDAVSYDYHQVCGSRVALRWASCMREMRGTLHLEGEARVRTLHMSEVK